MKKTRESWKTASEQRVNLGSQRIRHAGACPAQRKRDAGGICGTMWATFTTALAVLLSISASVPCRAEAADLLAQFKPEDPVQTIQVKLEVGAAGAALNEPVALDLGLGFPLWLRAVDKPENTVPFGAVPQQTDAKGEVAAGSSATYTFSLTGDAGQDVFQTTSQLLAGVRVSDIARVGFGSKGASDWALAGYEIRINGQVLAGAKPSGVKAKTALDAARTKLEEVGKKVAPLLTERAELEDLASAKLANEADSERLEKVKESLKPLEADKARLERQLGGLYPWWEDAGFRPPWREKPSVQSAKVILETSGHEAADTQNYVYFRTGGRKYVLTSPEVPLAPQMGPQEFTLDLLSGPLSAADLRGWAVGMLAPPTPFGHAPDRWHPQRVVVQLDDRIVYDSDENPLDQKSLEAVRLIPPAHLDKDGKVVVNTPSVRETFVWEAGRGQGLDKTSGEALDLPPEGGPEPETETTEGAAPPDEGGSDFPGEGPCDGGDMWQGGGGGYPGSGGHAGFWFWLGWWLSHVAGLDPPPWGGPFNIEGVEMAGGFNAGDQVIVSWHVSGDESQISGYMVYLQETKPGEVSIEGASLGPPVFCAVQQHECPLTLPSNLQSNVYYVRPVVVALSPALTQKEGPTRPIFPQAFELFSMSLHWTSISGPGGAWTISDPAVTSHNAVTFEQTSVAPFVAVDAATASLDLGFKTMFSVAPRKYRLVAFVGLQGLPDADATLTATLMGGVYDNPAGIGPPAITISAGPVSTVITGGSSPMLLIETDVDTTLLAEPRFVLPTIRIEQQQPGTRPAIFSLRLIPL